MTRAVQELEQHYGVRLFERMYRRLTPTEAAQRLYPQAVYLLDTFDRMERELQGWDAHGTVRVGATVTLGGETRVTGADGAFGHRAGKLEARDRLDALGTTQHLVDLVLLEVADEVEGGARHLGGLPHKGELAGELLRAVLGKAAPAGAPGSQKLARAHRL